MGYNKDRYPRLKAAAYYILFCVWYVVSLLPMWVLYSISTFLSTLLFYVIRYRRKVVHQNIKDSYPNMSLKRRWLIERRFYSHFCDLFVESVKFFSISEDKMRKRMSFTGLERVLQSARDGRSCAIFLGHYANWEWISSLPLWLDRKDVLCTQLYHPLENLVTDKLICYTRQRFGGKNIAVDSSIRDIVRYINEGTPIIIGFIADQAPYWNNIHYWTKFLNHQDTPIFTGGERIAKKFDMDVYYMDVRRIKRGYYSCEIKLMSDNPKSLPDFHIIEQYTRMLEETINRAPSYWLWSHRRWKRTKDGYEKWKKDTNKAKDKV